MKGLAISNLAWPVARDDEMREGLSALGITGIELAPSKVWGDLRAVGRKDMLEYRKKWNDVGIEIVAFQSLLFGKNHLTLFGSEESRSEMRDYLRQVISMASILGARSLVFGSPKSRQRGSMPLTEAEVIASHFFHDLGSDAQDAGVMIVLEANPTSYDADFITTTSEAAAFVDRVDSPGFQLHLDTGGMLLACEDVVEMVRAYGSQTAHIHASAPWLGPLSQGTAAMRWGDVAKVLLTCDYSGWVSIEMKEMEGTDPVAGAISEVRALQSSLSMR